MLSLTPTKNRLTKVQSFQKLIEALKEKDTSARIRILFEEADPNHDFLKVIWSGPAGILLQNEITKAFIAVEDLNEIHAFLVNSPILNFQPQKIYFLR